jgi:hypothetical protein
VEYYANEMKIRLMGFGTEVGDFLGNFNEKFLMENFEMKFPYLLS